MKFVYFTDTHIRGTNPRSRKDNFIETLYNKLKEILEFIKKNKIDYVLFGGDLFDRPDTSLSVVQKFIELFKEYPQPIFMVLGNHDIYGQNPETVNRTILGIFEALGIIKILDKESIVLKEKDFKVKITGSSYIYDIDIDDSKSKYVSFKNDCDFLIHMVHGMLMDKPFIKEVPHTLIDDILQKTEADITLCGHYHNGFGIKKFKNKYFVNPGALVRINNSLSEIKRTPSFVLIDIDNGNVNIKIEELKGAPLGIDVIDREFVKIQEQKEVIFNKIIQLVNSYGDYELMSLDSIIEDIAKKESIPENIKKEALERLAKAQFALSKEEVID